ncbi:MAG: PEP-CTERM sorting domain-containing protein [Chlamydiota bacterium]|nr:PEP-CTERM sorting domain-containing protein [Chlamydiota bacterium]
MRKLIKLLAISAMCFLMYPVVAQADYITSWELDRWVLDNTSTTNPGYDDMDFNLQSDANHIYTGWPGPSPAAWVNETNETLVLDIEHAGNAHFLGNVPYISVGYDVNEIGWDVNATVAEAGNLYYFWKVPSMTLQGDDRVKMVLQNDDIPGPLDLFGIEFKTSPAGFMKVGVFEEDSFLGGTTVLATALIDETFGIRISWDSAGNIQAYYDWTTGLGDQDPTTYGWTALGSSGTLDLDSGMHHAEVRVTFNPEPSTLLLLSSTLFGLGLKRRKQRMLA